MPFRSEAQRRYLWKRNPALAKRWAHRYGSEKGLPYKVSRIKRRRVVRRHA